MREIYAVNNYISQLSPNNNYITNVWTDFHCIQLICVTDRYELQQRGLLHEEDIGVVPDIYSRNQDLDGEVKFLKLEVAKYKEAAM